MLLKTRTNVSCARSSACSRARRTRGTRGKTGRCEAASARLVRRVLRLLAVARHAVDEGKRRALVAPEQLAVCLLTPFLGEGDELVVRKRGCGQRRKRGENRKI